MAASARSRNKAAEERRYALYMYCFAIIISVPVWWRLTEIYRVHLPLEALDFARSNLTPTLVVSLCFTESSRMPSDARNSIKAWIEAQISNLLRSSDQVKISVKIHENSLQDYGPLLSDYTSSNHTSALIIDELLNEQRQPVDLVNDEQSDLTIYLLATSRRSLSDTRVLVMGKYLHGWAFLPASNSFHLDATINRFVAISCPSLHVSQRSEITFDSLVSRLTYRLQPSSASPYSDQSAVVGSISFLPQAICGVLLGETDAPTSLIPYSTQSSGAGSAGKGGREGGRRMDGPAALPRRIRATFSLLVGGGGGTGGRVQWDIEAAVAAYLDPFLTRIRRAYDVTVDSQARPSRPAPRGARRRAYASLRRAPRAGL